MTHDVDAHSWPGALQHQRTTGKRVGKKAARAAAEAAAQAALAGPGEEGAGLYEQEGYDEEEEEEEE